MRDYSMRNLMGIRRRRGVTILEVLFATGVVIIGLMGIASVIVVAGRRASEATRAAEAQALSQHWYGEALARGANTSGAWLYYNEATSGAAFFSKTLAATVPSRQSITIANTTLRELGTESVCLDPAFMASRDVASSTGASGWVRPGSFPYYHDRFNPLSDAAWALGAGASPWQDQPRMLRVTSTGVGTGAGCSKLMEKIFASQDELSITLDNGDKSVAPTRTAQYYFNFDPANPAASTPPSWHPTGLPATFMPVSKLGTEQQYSWIATLSPAETIQAPGFGINTSPKSLYTMSLVVIYKRDYTAYNPAIPSPRASGVAGRPEDGLQGERVAWAFPRSGNFSGGHGGRVQLIAGDGTSPLLHTGEWVMLSKYVDFDFTVVGPGLPTFRPFSIHRWYRVVGLDEEEKVGVLGTNTVPSSDPYGNMPPNEVWSRSAVLDGPDWDFIPALTVMTPSGAVTIPTPTQATIVKGAVSVIERIVEVK